MIRQGSAVRNCCACPNMDLKLWNVVQLGIGFMLVFSAFNTSSFIEEIVVDQLSKNTTSGHALDKNAGYYSLSIIYGVFTLSNFVAAPIVVALTAKWAMVLGALCYTAFMAMFVIYLANWTLYLMSAILGFGAAIIWTGQGNYLTLNSNSETIGRNSGILWALLQVCLPVGGIFLYFELGNDKSDLPMHTIRIVYICFTAIAAVGAAFFAFLAKPAPVSRRPSTENLVTNEESANVDGVVHEPQTQDDETEQAGFKSDLIDTFRLLCTRDMQLLSVVFFYSGIELTFWSGVYSTCLGRTASFESSTNRLLAFNSIFIGLGEVLDVWTIDELSAHLSMSSSHLKHKIGAWAAKSGLLVEKPVHSGSWSVPHVFPPPSFGHNTDTTFNKLANHLSQAGSSTQEPMNVEESDESSGEESEDDGTENVIEEQLEMRWKYIQQLLRTCQTLAAERLLSLVRMMTSPGKQPTLENVHKFLQKKCKEGLLVQHNNLYKLPPKK